MRFWFTLILSTVGISAGMTWLVMHQGAQFQPPARAASSAKAPPRITFESQTGLTIDANVLEAKTGPSAVGQGYGAVFTFKNEGQGPLDLFLLRKSNGCEVLLDGKPL